MIRHTSKLAWKDIQSKIGERQRQVLEVLRRGDMSNREIMRETGLEVNTVTPRVYELRKAGLVIEKGTKVDPETNRTVLVWGLAEEQLAFF